MAEFFALSRPKQGFESPREYHDFNNLEDRARRVPSWCPASIAGSKFFRSSALLYPLGSRGRDLFDTIVERSRGSRRRIDRLGKRKTVFRTAKFSCLPSRAGLALWRVRSALLPSIQRRSTCGATLRGEALPVGRGAGPCSTNPRLALSRTRRSCPTVPRNAICTLPVARLTDARISGRVDRPKGPSAASLP